MFNLKPTEKVKTRKRNIGSFLAMIFCTLVIVSSIGSSFAIKNSYAQARATTTTTTQPQLHINHLGVTTCKLAH